MRTLVSVALVVVISLSPNYPASADKLQMPRQGSANYVTYYATHSLGNLEMNDVGSAVFLEGIGITRNTDGQAFFDSMSVRCLFYSEAESGKPKGNGACTETDTDGDKVFSTFDATTQIHTVIGGTGKYQGISGSATYTMHPLVAPGPGWGAVVVAHKLTWQFK